MGDGRNALTAVRDLEHEDREELRLAVVMSGGSSLAVWMGGVTNEINRLRLARPAAPPGTSPTGTEAASGVYGEVLDLLATTCRVDVISGTSAGGLNGALLGLAIAREGSDLATLRNLWLEHGSFSSLLRDPFEADPPSLLKGDAYFLLELKEALKQLAIGSSTPVAHNPVDLMMTASMLTGSDMATPDDFGSLIIDSDHHALFRFRRGEVAHHVAGCPHTREQAASDDFVTDEVVGRLALAARSTASFPVVFEPSYVPIGPDDVGPNRPNMICHATFQKSRFVLDGGVLMNKPLRPALDAIFEQTADKQVRRVLAYIVPDPGERVIEEPDPKDEVPSVLRVGVDSLITIPRNESVARDIRVLRAHNDRVRATRGRRAALVLALPDMNRTARSVYSPYRELRTRSSVGRILDQVARGVKEMTHADATAPLWNLEPLRSALTRARSSLMHPRFPSSDEVREGGWRWGVETIEHIADVVLNLLSQPLKLTNPRDPSKSDARRGVREALGAAHSLLWQERELARLWGIEYWRTRARSALVALEDPSGEAAAGWAAASFAGWTGDRGQLKELAHSFAHTLAGAVADIEKLLDPSVNESGPVATQAERLLAMTHKLVVPDDPWPTLMNLLALEVVETVLAPGERDVDQPVALIQISGNTPNGFDSRSDALTKIAGIKLGHFAAFYKESWRASDWMWGRLDGAHRLAQALFDPARLRQLGHSSAEVVAALEPIVLGPENSDLRAVLADGSPQGWDKTDALKELAFLDRANVPRPTSLPVCTRAIARRLQLEILIEELPQVAHAIQRDELAKAFEPVGARSFATDVLAAMAPEEPSSSSAAEVAPTDRILPPKETPALFRRCRVSEETISDEMTSDLFAATASKAAAVVTSVGQGSKSGLPILRGAFAFVRGAVIAIYLLAQNALRKGAFGGTLVVAALAFGAICLSAAMLDESTSGWVLSTGLALVVGGFVWGAISTGAWRAVSAIAFTVFFAVSPYLLVEINGWLVDDGSFSDKSLLADITDFAEDNKLLFIALALFIGPMVLATYRRERPLEKFVSSKRNTAIGICAFAVIGGLAFVFLMLAAKLDPSILEFEFSWSAENVRNALTSWGETGDLSRVEQSTGWDFLFIVGYVAVLSTSAFVAGELWRARGNAQMARAGVWTGRAMFIAGVADVAENLLIFRLLGDAFDGSTLPRAMTTLAALKFAIVLAGLAVSASAVVAARRPRADPATSSPGPQTALQAWAAGARWDAEANAWKLSAPPGLGAGDGWSLDPDAYARLRSQLDMEPAGPAAP